MSPRKSMAAVIALALFSFFAFGCGEREGSAETAAPEAKTVKVEVMPIKPGPMKDVLILPGQTEAIQDVRIGAERDGQVEWVGPQEGEAVVKGQLLAKIDVAALKAALDRAEAAAKLAQDLATRRRSLNKRGVLPKEDLERALTEEVVKAGDLREARVHYEQGFVRSPINGVVNKLFVDPGEFVSRGNPVADLVNVERIRVNVSVPEMDVRYLKMGQQARVAIDAFPERDWVGKVDFVSYKGDDATKTFKCRIVVDNPDKSIRPGMIARAAFLRRVIPDALAAPLFAILDKGGERIVYVEKDGVAKARTVAIGVLAKDKVQITKGLKPGDRLIVAGHTDVEEGMRVTTQ